MEGGREGVRGRVGGVGERGEFRRGEKLGRGQELRRGEELGRGEKLGRGEELGRGEGVKWLVVRGRAWSWARIGRRRASVVGASRSWACICRGRVWIVAGVVVGRGRSSFVVAGRCRPWVGRCRLCGMVVRGWWGGGSSWSLGVVAWVSFGGAGYRLWALGVARGRWVPLWALGIVRGRRVVVNCVLWALGLFRVRCTSFCRVRSLSGVMSLLGVGSLLGVRSFVACFGGPGSQLG